MSRSLPSPKPAPVDHPTPRPLDFSLLTEKWLIRPPNVRVALSILRGSKS